MEARLTSLVAAPDARRSGAGALQGETLAADALLVLLHGQALEAHPRSRSLYYPFPAPSPPPPPNEIFAAAEALEFRQHDYAQAAAAFRTLSNATDPVVRAGALLRLGRVSRKSGDADLALKAYSDLTRLDAIGLEGLPADLLARYNRCQVLAGLGRNAELRAEASSLLADLRAGRWHLTAPVYTFYSQHTALWHEPPADATAEREVLALPISRFPPPLRAVPRSIRRSRSRATQPNSRKFAGELGTCRLSRGARRSTETGHRCGASLRGNGGVSVVPAGPRVLSSVTTKKGCNAMESRHSPWLTLQEH